MMDWHRLPRKITKCPRDVPGRDDKLSHRQSEGADMRSRTFTLLSMSAIVAVTALSFCGPAAADDRDTCKTASGDTAIAACSRAIASKKYKGSNLSLLHTNRGAEYGAKEDYTRAIADHDQAIKIDPK